jgi:hypothetical protein
MRNIGFLFLSCFLLVSTGSAQFRRALLLHHSVGLTFWDRSEVSNLSPPTTIREEVVAYNSAHGLSGDQEVSMDETYGPIGPSLPNAYQGYWWRWAQVFSGHDPWGYSLDQFYGDYPVIIIKTGYPTTQYTRNSDSVEACKSNWRFILSAMRDHPNTFFVLWTGYPAPTDGHSERAALTNDFVHWATDVLAAGDDEFGPVPDNVYIFDAFHVLASSDDGYCDPVYGSWGEGPGGDHPSNEAVAVFDPIFVNAVFDAAIAHEDGALPLTWGGPPSVIRLPSGHAQVEWTTLSEIHTWMFYLQKKDRVAWRSIDSVHGAGNSVDPRKYILRDPETTTGSATYRLKEVDLDRSVHVSESVTLPVTGVPLAVAFENAMEQNYPNPFNPTTTIRFRLAEQANVKLELYNILGERMKTLREGVHPAGVHEVVVDAGTLPSGVYYYTLSAGRYVETKRLVLIR